MTFIDGRMFDSLNRLFATTCTIQESTETQNASGQVLDDWNDLADHVDIPCVVGRAVSRAEAEQRRPQATIVRTDRVIALGGYYPDIMTKHRAVVDGTNWNILDVYHDPSAAYTQLAVEVVSVT